MNTLVFVLDTTNDTKGVILRNIFRRERDKPNLSDRRGSGPTSILNTCRDVVVQSTKRDPQYLERYPWIIDEEISSSVGEISSDN